MLSDDKFTNEKIQERSDGYPIRMEMGVPKNEHKYDLDVSGIPGFISPEVKTPLTKRFKKF